MSTLTSIGDARTPETPVEVTLAGSTSPPNANQEVLLIGHRAASGGSVSSYVPSTISNSGDPAAGKAEAETKFGTGSEIAKMVAAAIKANAGGSIFPQLKCIALANADTDYGSADAALTAAQKVKAEFIVSPYDGTTGTLRDKLKNHAILVSGANRTANNQFGSAGVMFNRNVTDPANLPVVDSQFMMCVYLRDTGVSADAPDYSIAEMAAAYAAKQASLAVPFNPLDDETIGSVAAPKKITDWPTVGANAESETTLNKGWTPLYVKPNGEVAIVRSITTRISADGTGTPVVTDYYDMQDFMVLYYLRKTLYTRFKQKDFKKKNSKKVQKKALGEVIRILRAFEDEEMLQAVDQLAKLVKVQTVVTDRHAFEIYVPVNVIPGLHRKKINVEGTTLYDVITVD